MNIQIQRRSKPLNQRNCTSVGHLVGLTSLFDQTPGSGAVQADTPRCPDPGTCADAGGARRTGASKTVEDSWTADQVSLTNRIIFGHENRGK